MLLRHAMKSSVGARQTTDGLLETWRVGDERIDSPVLVEFIVR